MYYSIYMCNNRNGMGKLYLVEHIFKYLLLGIEGLACGTPWATAAQPMYNPIPSHGWWDVRLTGSPDPEPEGVSQAGLYCSVRRRDTDWNVGKMGISRAYLYLRWMRAQDYKRTAYDML